MAKGLLLLDTSVMLEILRVPGKSDSGSPIYRMFHEMMASMDFVLYLPIATIMETGNHISQIKGKDGNLRRCIGQAFAAKVKMALAGTTPFKALSWEAKEIALWIDSYPDCAMKAVGLGDLSIIKQYEKLCDESPAELPVKIWSKDNHLSSYSRNWDGLA